MPRWDIETDVAVIGFGAAGSCAAIEARAAGADVVFLGLPHGASQGIVPQLRAAGCQHRQGPQHRPAGLRFIGNLNIGLNRSRRSVDSQRETNLYAVGELSWRLKKPALNSAGWDLRLSFSHQDFEDVLDVSRSGAGHQVFLGLTMTLPAATRD